MIYIYIYIYMGWGLTGTRRMYDWTKLAWLRRKALRLNRRQVAPSASSVDSLSQAKPIVAYFRLGGICYCQEGCNTSDCVPTVVDIAHVP